MVRERLSSLAERLRDELDRALLEDNSPSEIAGSFSIGVFITSMPTLGTGLFLFVVLAYLSDRISKIALLASVIVLNPVVKWGVYAASFWLGIQLLGVPPGGVPSTVSLSAGSEIVVRLLVGNLIIAVVFTAIAYPLSLRLVRECHRRNLEPTELPAEILSD